MKITTSAQLVGATPRVDRTMTLRFVTQELNSQEKVVLMDLLQEQGWLLFSPDEISEKDIPDEKSTTEGKTPSQRLRARLFVYYNKIKGDGIDFDRWYKNTLDKIGQSYLDKIND